MASDPDGVYGERIYELGLGKAFGWFTVRGVEDQGISMISSHSSTTT
jgi:hypothetical protein